MQNDPVLMEDYFSPGFKTKPAVLVGSQTLPLFHGNIQEQAWEGCYLAAAIKDDIVVVRNFDPSYLNYWKSLMDSPHIINIKTKKENAGKYLTEVILEDPTTIELIKHNIGLHSKLMVFIPTLLEQELADNLGIPLHGVPEINELYGTKSGIRKLSKKTGIPMAPGFVCSTLAQVEEATAALSRSFETIVIKHDASLSGYFSKKLRSKEISDLRGHLDEIAAGKFIDKKDIAVVEGWLKSKVSLCAHIEILEGQKPIICAGWQQIIGDDGISYVGAGPLMLSEKAMKSFITQVNKVASFLHKEGAVGSYAPDFLIVDQGEKDLEEDTCVLVELNARVPYTAFPLEIIKQVRGRVGNGFLAQHINLHTPSSFSEIKEVLQKEKLLIRKKDRNATGVIPYNVGLLPWKLFDIVAMADSWIEVLDIMRKINSIFQPH